MSHSNIGQTYTGKLFNADLKAFLGSVIDYSSMGKVSLHSFRIGIITMLGKLGFSDQKIMAMALDILDQIMFAIY